MRSVAEADYGVSFSQIRRVLGVLNSEMRCTDYCQVLWAGVMPAFLVLDPATEELRVPLVCFPREDFPVQ